MECVPRISLLRSRSLALDLHRSTSSFMAATRTKIHQPLHLSLYMSVSQSLSLFPRHLLLPPHSGKQRGGEKSKGKVNSKKSGFSRRNAERTLGTRQGISHGSSLSPRFSLFVHALLFFPIRWCRRCLQQHCSEGERNRTVFSFLLFIRLIWGCRLDTLSFFAFILSKLDFFSSFLGIFFIAEKKNRILFKVLQF